MTVNIMVDVLSKQIAYLLYQVKVSFKEICKYTSQSTGDGNKEWSSLSYIL
jgi:hypothetical protein